VLKVIRRSIFGIVKKRGDGRGWEEMGGDGMRSEEATNVICHPSKQGESTMIVK
jgi:hypothetical protein